MIIKSTMFILYIYIYNEVAHTLAKEATRNKIEHNWIGEYPLSILNIVTREQHCL